jgi:hypothetical protein
MKCVDKTQITNYNELIEQQKTKYGKGVSYEITIGTG